MKQTYLKAEITKNAKGWNVFCTYTHGSRSTGGKTLAKALYEAIGRNLSVPDTIVINGTAINLKDLPSLIKDGWYKDRLIKALNN